MTRRTQELWATFAVGFVGITWGCWWIFLRLIEARGISPGWTLATVYGASGLLLLPLFAWRWRRWRPLVWPVLAVGVAYGLPLAFWSHAVIHGNVVRVTLLFYMTPVWGTLLAVTVFGERLTPLRLLAVILGLAGAAAVLGLDQGAPIPRSTQEWMALLAGALFALAAAASRRWPAVSGYDSSFVMFLCGAVLGVVFAGLFGGETVPAAASVVSVLPVAAFLGIVFAIPSQFVLCWAAARLDPGRVSTLIMFDVFATTISARLLTSEPFGWHELVGCLAILAAGVTSGVDQMRQSRLALAQQPAR
ncbi:MAG TPA: DMT family transporter [Candidatus Acidoferrum sp.]|nr:DMT family transporter [Candidatus Acidoferrum sp.]